MEPGAKQVIRNLRTHSTKERALLSARFFKTGKGEYGEGDVFLGVTMPEVRKVAKSFIGLPMKEALLLLESDLHEVRMCGLVIWTLQFEKENEQGKKKIFDAYLSHTSRINNWDLVDVSAPRIVGGYLLNRDRGALLRLATSKSLWERRIAVVATLAFIVKSDATTTFAVSDLVLHDDEDLMHKATGWMLREVGKRCGKKLLVDYLRPRYSTMPRTTLRYAIEHFSPVERKRWLLGKV